MLLLAAALLEVAGRLAAAMQCSETLLDMSAHHKKLEHNIGIHPAPSKQAAPKPVHKGGHRNSKLGDHDPQLMLEPPQQPRGSSSGAWQGLTQLFEGFRLIAKSSYLCHVCLHFVLHYLVSTLFYFEKTLVVASGGGSASQRVTTFATINSMSAGAVALIQLTATVQRASHHISTMSPPCFFVHTIVPYCML